MILLSFLSIGLLAQDARQTLLSQLTESGLTHMQPVEIALIAGGVSESDLPQRVSEYETMIRALTANVDADKPAKKVAKQLFGDLFRQLKSHDEGSFALTELMDTQTYSTLTATFVFYDAAQRLGLNVQVVETPIHFFAILKDDKRDVFIEFFDRTSYDKRYSDYQSYARDLLTAGITDEQGLANIEIQDRFDLIRSQRRGITARELAADFFIKAASQKGFSGADQGVIDLEISNKLGPESWFGAGNLDREIHGKIHELYQAKETDKGLDLAIAGAQRFPQYQDFEPFLFNFAVLRIQALDQAKDYTAAFAVASRVASLLEGEAASQFGEVFPTLNHNYAVHLSQSKQYREALESAATALNQYTSLRAELANRPGADAKMDDVDKSINAITDMIPRVQYAWTQELLKEGDHSKANQILAELEKTAPEMANQIKTNLDQQALQDLYEAGDYAEAMVIAAKRLTDPNGLQNYLATYNRYVSELIRQAEFERAFAVIDEAPSEVQDHTISNDLRYNAYIAWLNQVKDQAESKQLPIYAQMFADMKINFTADERAALISNHVAVFASRVEKSIASGAYDRADKQLAEAEQTYPKEPSLLALRQKIRTIQERLSE